VIIMADVFPQLEFNGDCRQAFEKYAKLFGGEITVMNTLGETKDVPLPPGSTAGAPDMVRFAELRLGSTRILGNDLPSEQYKSPYGFNLAMHFEKADEARRIFDSLAEGGAITVPPAKVAWAELFGMVTDRFGIPWLILGFSD
jgi:PhnB protein